MNYFSLSIEIKPLSAIFQGSNLFTHPIIGKCQSFGLYTSHFVNTVSYYHADFP